MNKRPLLENRPDLTTDRLFLRRPNDGDVDAIVNTVGDWEVARRLSRIPHPYAPADARFFLDQIVPAEWAWAVTLRDSDTLIGVVGLTPEQDADTVELGYWLSAAHWGLGIATEVGRAVVEFGFERLDLPYLTSGYFRDNPSSGRVLRKLGFVEVGEAMRPCLAVSHDVSSVVMKLSRPA